MQHKKTLISIIIILCLSGLLFMGYRLLLDDGEYKVTTEDQDSSINYGPPSKDELSETEANKERVVKRQDLENTKLSTSESKVKVVPEINPLGQSADGKTVSVSAYISEVYESGGKCTAIFEKGDQRKTVNQDGRKDATVTTCGLMSIQRSALSSGKWQVSVSYKSNKAEGVSTKETLDVK